ncbi:MAG: hypothetical protein R3D67_11490 [Hyphomicrobiaceae bacterium]
MIVVGEEAPEPGDVVFGRIAGGNGGYEICHGHPDAGLSGLAAPGDGATAGVDQGYGLGRELFEGACGVVPMVGALAGASPM